MIDLSGTHVIILLAVIAFYVVSIWAIIITVRDTTVLPFMSALWVTALIIFPGFGFIAWISWRLVRKKSGLPGLTNSASGKR